MDSNLQYSVPRHIAKAATPSRYTQQLLKVSQDQRISAHPNTKMLMRRRVLMRAERLCQPAVARRWHRPSRLRLGWCCTGCLVWWSEGEGTGGWAMLLLLPSYYPYRPSRMDTYPASPLHLPCSSSALCTNPRLSCMANQPVTPTDTLAPNSTDNTLLCTAIAYTICTMRQQLHTRSETLSLRLISCRHSRNRVQTQSILDVGKCWHLMQGPEDASNVWKSAQKLKVYVLSRNNQRMNYFTLGEWKMSTSYLLQIELRAEYCSMRAQRPKNRKVTIRCISFAILNAADWSLFLYLYMSKVEYIDMYVDSLPILILLLAFSYSAIICSRRVAQRTLSLWGLRGCQCMFSADRTRIYSWACLLYSTLISFLRKLMLDTQPIKLIISMQLDRKYIITFHGQYIMGYLPAQLACPGAGASWPSDWVGRGVALGIMKSMKQQTSATKIKRSRQPQQPSLMRWRQ